MSDTYFAALPPEDLTRKLSSKIDEYYQFCSRYGFTDRWRKSYLAYYGMSESGADSASLNQMGENGEEFVVKVNQYRSLIQNLLTMTTAQRPSLQPKAANTDSKSFAQTILARSVLDYYLTEKHLESALKTGTEFALIGGEGFIELKWNATAGKIYTVAENGAPVFDGDAEFAVYHPVDVIRECWAENNQNQKWYIVREFKNKYDLAAKYPDLAEEILALSKSADFTSKYTYLTFDSQTDSDFIPVYRFFHPESEALPNGRQTEFLDIDLVLNDGPLAYKSVPVYRIAPANYHGTVMGYTIGYDLLGLQKYYDSLQSIICTNQLNYGIQNILLPRGGEVNVVQLSQGLNGIEYDPKTGEPKPLNLLSTPPEVFNQCHNIEHLMETLSGVNSVARGNPEASLKSGAALALVAAQAVQFNNGLQNSYNLLVEDVGTGLIELLQMYATTPRIASIAGKSNRARVKEFLGSDLDGIHRVTVEQVNPISKTAAGRLQLAQDMLNSGLIKTPQHYIEVVTTGQIESLYEHETSQMLLIRSENEDLADGKTPTVTIIDEHILHVKEHATCLDSPEARANPDIVKNVTAHIQAHINALRTADPQLLQLLGQQPLQAPQPQGPGPQAPAPKGPQGPNIPANMNPTPPVVQEAQGVQGPRMPSLPKQAPQQAGDAYAQMKASSGQ